MTGNQKIKAKVGVHLMHGCDLHMGEHGKCAFLVVVTFSSTFVRRLLLFPFRIKNLEQLRESVSRLHLETQLMDNCGDYVNTCLPRLLQLLDRGVGRRVNLMHIRFSPPVSVRA